MEEYKAALTEKVADATNKALRYLAIEHNNASMHDMLIGILENAKVPGAKAVRTGLNNVRKAVSDVDAEIGYQMGGGQKKGMGALLFRDKEDTNLVPVDYTSGTKRYIQAEETIPKHTYERFEYPSITKPIKAVGNLVVPTLAFTKGIDILENRGGKQNNEQRSTH